MDGKQGAASVHYRGQNPPNLKVFPSVTSSLTTSIPPESLAVSGQSSVTGILSPSLMYSLGRRKDSCNPHHDRHHAWGAMPTPSLFQHCHPVPLSPPESSPSKLSPFPTCRKVEGERQERAAVPVSLSCSTAHPFCLLPLAPSPPHTHPPPCLIQGRLGVPRAAAGIDTNLCQAAL